MQDSDPKIMILDDDPAITDLLSDVFEQEGYKVRALNSSKDVLYLAQQFLPDLLLLDIMMPEVDGYDVCQYFKRDPYLKFTRVVILTARDSRESRIRCYKAGADIVIGKPFEIDELREIVRSNVHSKRAFDQLLVDFRHQTILDPVVNCYTRKYLDRRIGEELKRVDRYKRPLSLLLLDLDNFKSINVRYGFSFGNAVLKDVAEAVRQEIRECDLLGRYAEDSFVIMLPETPKTGAKSVVSRIQEVVSSLVFLKKKRLVVRVSVAALVVDKVMKTENAFKELEEKLKAVQAHKLGRK